MSSATDDVAIGDFHLDVANVSKRFGDRIVLSDFDMSITRGEFVAITGPSGSGKSTALNIAGLIAAPTQGQIRINGREMTSASDAERSRCRGRHLSFVYQSFHLALSLTVAENIELGIRSQLAPVTDVRSRVSDALDSVGIGHLAGHFPGTLSGGEQQRAAIARALARRTPLLLADEPTGNLDQANADIIFGLMRQQVDAGAALILVTHDTSLADRADRIVTLSPPTAGA